MNTFVRMGLVMCALTLLIIPSVAQIAITQTNVASIMNPGNTFLKQYDTVTTSLNIGTGGGPNTWNFSGLAANMFQRHRVVGVSAIPQVVRSQIPNGTHFFAIDTSYQGLSGTVYINLVLNSSGLYNVGIAGVAFGLVAATQIPGPNPEALYAFPLAVSTRWRTAFTNNSWVLIGTQPPPITHDASYYVDAYGRMTLPGGQVHDALRIRKYNLYNNLGYDLSYIFLARGGAQVEVVATSADTNQNGTINIRRKSLVWNPSVVSDPLDVRLGEAVPSEFSLKQNYPNPFNPSTRIEYQVAKEELVSLKVFNLLGQEVATLVNESKMPGTYAVDWNGDGLPSGMYFYKMQSSSFSSTRRMMLLK